MTTYKNHFFMPYAGNKRNEVELIFNNMDLTNITTIVEPYCGSCAFSVFLSHMYPGKFHYVLNDNNKWLIQLFRLLQDEERTNNFIKTIDNIYIDMNKEKYNNLDKSLLSTYYIHNKSYYIRPGMYNEKRNKTIKHNFNCPFTTFIRNENVSLSSDEGIKVYEYFKDKNDCLMFVDPPYILSSNEFYNCKQSNIYEYLYFNNIEKEQGYIILILENKWIIQLLFNHVSKKLTYDKKYEMTKKKTTHILIFNR